MRLTCLAFGVCLTLAHGAGIAQPERPAQTAGDIENAAVFRFRVTDDSGAPTPVRLSFRTPEGASPNLFTNANAKPLDLAVRQNLVHALSGEGLITVPPGRYTVWASHGLEWSVDSVEVDLRPGEITEWTTTLTHEVDTSGWISGDFHLHTLTHSGHGDSNMPERIITLIAEGVEFAVATDHNHNIDYGPTIDELDAMRHVTAVVGNEVSTPIGHFNAFPLDPTRPVPPANSTDARKLFALIRSEPNAFGITPVIQLNHPRWEGLDYFNLRGLDPILAESADPEYSDDFDTIEIFNENAGWGYFDPADASVDTGSQTDSVLKDWFRLLNRGHRYAAVGNSDSHTVAGNLAGYPRNFVVSRTDDPGAIDVVGIAEAIRERSVFTTIGPFVEFRVEGRDMGSVVTTRALPDGQQGVELGIRIQAASWVDCDRVKIIVNGDVVDTIEVPQKRSVVRLETTYALPLAKDSWVTICVEGDDPLDPIVADHGRPIYPLAVMNPVWVDAESDGVWTSPLAAAQNEYRSAHPRDLAVSMPSRPAHERALLMQAVAGNDIRAVPLVAEMLVDPDRYVRQSALLAAGRLGDGRLLPFLRSARAVAEDDRTRMAAARALIECGDPNPIAVVAALAADGVGEKHIASFSDALNGMHVQQWRAVGPFAGEMNDLTDRDFGPEADPHAGSYSDAGEAVAWRQLAPDENGFVDLNAVAGEASAGAVVYARCTVTSPGERQAMIGFGSDDGSVLTINGERVVVDKSRHGATPLAHIVPVTLKAGENEVLVKVFNGTGDFGFYLQFFDDDLSTSAGAARSTDNWWNDAVFYEIFVRSFADSTRGPLAGDGVGDLRGIIERLDYLNDGDPATHDDLGVTALWLMPIAESPSYHGYDVVDYKTVDREYGTNADFVELVDACHARGMRVIVDTVINHCSSEHPWFGASTDPASPKHDWFVWVDTPPTGEGAPNHPVWHDRFRSRNGQFYYGFFWRGMPDFNLRSAEATAAVHDFSRFWLTEMKADGLRLDAIKHLIEDGVIFENTPETTAWLADYNRAMHAASPDAFLVGEVWSDTATIDRFLDSSVDSAFSFPLAAAIGEAINTGDARVLRTALREIVSTGRFDRLSTFIGNHDMDRVIDRLGGSRARCGTAATLLLTLPGVPFIYYGEEIGMRGVKPDEDIRTPMQWTADALSAGFSSAEPWRAPNDDTATVNVESQAASPSSLLHLYRRLVALRSSSSALRSGKFRLIDAGNYAVLAFERVSETQKILVVANLSAKPIAAYRIVGVEGKPLREMLHGTDVTPNIGYPIAELAPYAGYVIEVMDTPR